MYLDTSDSVRFNAFRYDIHSAKASVASNPALRNSIVLSQTQLIDTKFILERKD